MQYRNRQFRNRLGRPHLRRLVRCSLKSNYFKPRGVPMSDLEVIEITNEEVEAMRLKNIKGLDQVECAKQMKTSQSTFQRILSSAYKKVSQALVDSKAIKIAKKEY